MLKVLGWLFIIGGILLCLTIFLIGAGIPCIGLGALLLIASALTGRRREREESGDFFQS